MGHDCYAADTCNQFFYQILPVINCSKGVVLLLQSSRLPYVSTATTSSTTLLERQVPMDDRNGRNRRSNDVVQNP